MHRTYQNPVELVISIYNFYFISQQYQSEDKIKHCCFK